MLGKKDFMFVVSAGKGSLSKYKTGEYQLTMDLPNVDQVTVFSQRPKRIVTVISGKYLSKFWYLETNNFESSPPNALLSTQENRSIVVVLQSSMITGNKIVFKFKIVDKKQKFATKFTSLLVYKIVLTIDSSTSSEVVCSKGQTTCIGAWDTTTKQCTVLCAPAGKSCDMYSGCS